MIVTSKIYGIGGNWGTGTLLQPRRGSEAEPSLQPAYLPNTAGYNEPGEAHLSVNKAGESDGIKEGGGFLHS